MISAILLAAGLSQRMGSLKQLLPYQKSTFIQTCITNLLETKVEEVVVVLGFCAPEISKHLVEYPVKIIINNEYQQGMTSSLQKGLATISPASEAVLIALVDQPQIGSNIMIQLIEAYEQEHPLIVKPTYQGRSGHPIIIDLKLKDEILALNPNQGLNEVTRVHRADSLLVAIDSREILEDFDTPEDYQRLK